MDIARYIISAIKERAWLFNRRCTKIDKPKEKKKAGSQIIKK